MAAVPRDMSRGAEDLVFTIGEFSKITGLTVKTLRFYHEQGLLIPTSVERRKRDIATTDRSKVETARTHTYLRSLDLSLDRSARFLGNAGTMPIFDEVMVATKRPSLSPRSSLIARICARCKPVPGRRSEARNLMEPIAVSNQRSRRLTDPILIAGIRTEGPIRRLWTGLARLGRSLGRLDIKRQALDAALRFQNTERTTPISSPCTPVRKVSTGRRNSRSGQLPAAVAFRSCTRGRYEPASLSRTPRSLHYIRWQGLRLVRSDP